MTDTKILAITILAVFAAGIGIIEVIAQGPVPVPYPNTAKAIPGLG